MRSILGHCPQALGERIRKCRAGEFAAPDIGKGIDYEEKPFVEVPDEEPTPSEEQKTGDTASSANIEQKEADPATPSTTATAPNTDATATTATANPEQKNSDSTSQ